jgi:hypothetical protein
MESQTPRNTLIVANLTASTPILLQAVKRRADERPTNFTLLVPNAKGANDWALGTAVELMERAAGKPVKGVLGDAADPFDSVKQALDEGNYDEVIISTLPKRASEWLKKDLPTRVEALNVPVTVITPPEGLSPLKAFTEQFSAKNPPTAAT